jgi:hypothetical protein
MVRAAADLRSASTAPGVSIPPTRVEEFNREAYEQFRLPERLGNAIAAWDEPRVVAGVDATHMRGDDYVIGLTWNGSARAYPLWVVDNYHAINDTIDGQRILVASCERCQSGAAFAPDLPVDSGRPPVFRAIGVLNAVLLFKDLATGTWWNHYEGFGLKGRLRGHVLPWLPTYHMEWAAWLAMHPRTDVMLAPADPTHPDARHGHGREESFSRPGMDPAFIATIVGPLDDRYPENEMVLGVREPSHTAYPLREVQRDGGVVHDEGTGTLVFAGPRPDGFTMAAFEAPEGSVTFRREGDGFLDEESGSVWRIDGLAVEGPRRGGRLRPRPWSYVRWHAWVYMHRDTSLFVSDRRDDGVPPLDAEDPDGFGRVLAAFSAEGHDVRIEGPPVSQLRPREALASLTVQVDGSRVHLHRFETVRAARDYHGLGGGWSSLPFRVRVRNGKTRRLGRIVVIADPERRFADSTQVVPLSTTEMAWSNALLTPSLEESVQPDGDDARQDPDPGFLEVIRALKLAGYEVIEAAFLPPGQLRVGCSNGVALTIEGDRFLLYRFTSPADAETYAATEAHARAFGPFVLRSTPDSTYDHQLYEILYAGDGLIRWSSLLDTPRFVNTVHRAANPRAHGGGL